MLWLARLAGMAEDSGEMRRKIRAKSVSVAARQSN